jgi:hypothetical protein
MTHSFVWTSLTGEKSVLVLSDRVCLAFRQ